MASSCSSILPLARSVSRGAQISGVSQSAASQHLQETERVLGVQLLDRSTRPLVLTESGRLYYEFCRDVLRRKQEFDEALDKLRGRVQGTVRVAAIYSVGISDMSRLEEELSRRMPEAELLVEYLRPEKVYDAVVTDQADLGLVSYPESNKEITAIPWREERMMVAARRRIPWQRRRRLSLADLAQQDFVAFDDDLRVGREVKRYLRESGAHVNVSMLDTLVRARYPLIYLVTWEEQRLDAILDELAERHGKALLGWSVTKGLRRDRRRARRPGAGGAQGPGRGARRHREAHRARRSSS